MRMSSPLFRYLNKSFSTIILAFTFSITFLILILFNYYRIIVPYDIKNALAFVSLFMIPFILVLVEITLSQNRTRGFLSVISTFKFNFITYISGLVIILGYTSLLIAFSYEITALLQLILGTFIHFNLSTSILMFSVILFLFLAYLVFNNGYLKFNKWHLFVLLGLIVILIVISIIILNVSSADSPFIETLKVSRYRVPRYLSLITKMFGILWVIDIVSIRWKSFSLFKSKFYRTSWPVIIVVLMISWGIGYIFSLSLPASYVAFKIDRFVFQAIFAEHFKNLDLLYLIVNLFLFITSAYIVLDSAIINFYKLSSNPASYFIYDKVKIKNKVIDKKKYSFLFVFFATIFMALTSDLDTAMELSAISFLALMIFMLVPLLSDKSILRKDRWFKLPLYPLLQIVAIVMALTMPINLQFKSILIVLVWLFMWSAFYLYNLRKHKIKRMISQSIPLLSIDDNKFNVLVVYNFIKNNVNDLLPLAINIAKSENGKVVLLNVESGMMNGNSKGNGKKAENSSQIKNIIESLNEDQKAFVVPLNVKAESIEEGVHMVINDYDIDLIFGEFSSFVTQITAKKEEKFLEQNITEDVYMMLGHYNMWNQNDIYVVVSEFSDLQHIQECIRRVTYGDNKFNLKIFYVIENDSNAESFDYEKTLDEIIESINGDNVAVDKVVVKLKDFERLLNTSAKSNLLIGEPNAKSVKSENTDEHLVGLKHSSSATKSDEKLPLIMFDISHQHIFTDELSLSKRIFDKLLHANEFPKIIIREQENVSAYWLKSFWLKLIRPFPKASNKQKKAVRKRMLKDARPSIDFYVMITLSSIIATVGLMQNSVAVIIGGMLVAPLMSPILSSSFNLVTGDIKHLFLSMESTIRGIIISIIVAFVLAYLIPDRTLTTEILARTRPSILDLIVAIAAGLAAVYAIVKKENAAALPGVAIAASLEPPLAVVGIGLGDGYFDVAFGAFVLFITNLIAIMFFGAVMFMALGFSARNNKDKETVKRGVQFSVIALIVITLLLAISTYNTIRETFVIESIEREVRSALEDNNTKIQDISVKPDKDAIVVHVQTIFTGDEINKEQVDKLVNELNSKYKKEVKLKINVIRGIQLNK